MQGESKKVFGLLVVGLVFVFLLSGCVVRTYKLTKDRVDQNLSGGNRGYLMGNAPAGEPQARKSTRTTQVIEVELGSPLKFEKMPKEKAQAVPQVDMPPIETEMTPMEGNRGFISESAVPETGKTSAAVTTQAFETYTVQKNDTLQKISQKYFGTTKKWQKIFEANSDILSGPNKIYPGQVIKIPVEGLKEPRQNLK